MWHKEKRGRKGREGGGAGGTLHALTILIRLSAVFHERGIPVATVDLMLMEMVMSITAAEYHAGADRTDSFNILGSRL